MIRVYVYLLELPLNYTIWLGVFSQRNFYFQLYTINTTIMNLVICFSCNFGFV